jgi:AraC family transcriptional regulator, regulatory protein of adaptative response / DNA-3-methyladenine glycosylase II
MGPRGAARSPDADRKSGVEFGVRIRRVAARQWGTISHGMRLTADICQRALRARDARFDGVFFVGITTTGIYCRPVCPSRSAIPTRRRFFESAAEAEHAGYRPCLRCRPELAPGRAAMDAVPRLAQAAALRIAAGALNGHSLADLARELGVSERHVRRALEREIGVSPIALAQTHRLLLAKRLLADTDLPVTRIAFASGFQSLRRFNAAFREHYRLNPSALRPRPVRPPPETDLVRLTLAYRAPHAWNPLLAFLERSALPGVEVVQDGGYGRTIRLDGSTGVVFVSPAAEQAHLRVDVSPSLLRVLMPLLVRLRHLFDLDAEPSVIDAHLSEGGLGALVRGTPGLRTPGAIDGFDAVLSILLLGSGRWGAVPRESARRVVRAFGMTLDSGFPALSRIAPTPERIAEAGAERLAELGLPSRRAAALVAVARALVDGLLTLEPGSDPFAARRALLALEGISERSATTIVMRALYWPDAFPFADPALRRAAGVTSPAELRTRAERWRPWRAYAAMHLQLVSEKEEGRWSTPALPTETTAALPFQDQ